MTTLPDADVRAARLARWDRIVDPFIVVAAIVPLIGNVTDVAPTLGSWTVELACWSVFLIDLLVRVRLRPGYLRTLDGKIDLFIVVATFPWSVAIGDERARLLALFRFARVARILVVFRRSTMVRSALDRLGRPTVALVATLLIGSWVVYRNEPASTGFDDYGDAVWFGIVSVTTVGYGELSATTTASRIASVVMIVVGLMFLGTVLAAATSALPGRTRSARGAPPARSDQDTADESVLAAEVRALRSEVRDLHALVERMATGSGEPGPGVRTGE